MKKKFFVRDDDDNQYEVEEIAEVETDNETTPVNDEDELTAEDIAALKMLANVADKLIQLVNAASEDEKESEEESEEDESVTDEDEDEEVTDADEEEVVDTDEVITHDSVRSGSIGAIEKRRKTVDSYDQQNEIASAWSKRYGGK